MKKVFQSVFDCIMKTDDTLSILKPILVLRIILKRYMKKSKKKKKDLPTHCSLFESHFVNGQQPKGKL